jgi:uncharacterized caspase-like protein
MGCVFPNIRESESCEFGNVSPSQKLPPIPFLLAVLCGAVVGPLANVTRAQPGPDGGPEAKTAASQKWAILIAVEKYHRATRLRFTNNDVKQLAQTLVRCGDYVPEQILEIVDTARNPRWQPLRTSLLAELPAFLAKPGPDDHVLVYFSGHGFKDKDGKLYLAPIDCDPADPPATGVAMDWFRDQIAGCRAKAKLLVLDACHAGGEKGGDATSVSARDLGTVLRDVTGVVTLASSTSEEQSQIWEEKEQSLFSYWLTQGLKGHADRDSDGSVTIDELYAYVHRNTTATAKQQFPKPQTPVRIVRTGTPGVPEVIHLKPQGLTQVLADIAEQMAWSMQERKLSKVGVLEFTNDTKLGELLGADFGLLGRFCAEELERRLLDTGTDRFGVVDRRRLQKAIADQRLSLGDLGSGDALKQLAERAGGMPALALGTLQSRTGRVVALQCRLLQTERDELAGIAGGRARLNESEWAMLGRSVHVRPEDRRPELPTGSGPGRATDDVLIERLDQKSAGAHPLLDPNFPYRVTIKVRAKKGLTETTEERAMAFRGNEAFVPLRRGEVYQISAENRSGSLVLMRLLVDGLNTLPEKIVTKAIVRERTTPQEEWLPAQRVSLNTARFWILDPKRSTQFTVAGFYSATGEAGKYREFLVVDEQKSLAARQDFTDQIGLITAAFYTPKSGSRAVGTGAGQERTTEVKEREGFECGNLLGVIHVRYVEPEALKEAEQ